LDPELERLVPEPLLGCGEHEPLSAIHALVFRIKKREVWAGVAPHLECWPTFQSLPSFEAPDTCPLALTSPRLLHGPAGRAASIDRTRRQPLSLGLEQPGIGDSTSLTAARAKQHLGRFGIHPSDDLRRIV
jgi:hypothetical protein